MYRKHVGRALILALMLSGATSMNAQRITRQFKNVPLKTVLAEVEKELQYSIIYKKDEVNERKQITRDFKDASLEEVLSAVLDNGLSYSVQGKMIVISKKEAAGSSITQQKQIIVKGIVKDENGEPVVGANVVEKGTSNGTITDMDGHFLLNEVSPNAMVSISYIGYKTEEIALNNRSSLTITLTEDSEQLDEVVVVGYGTQKKVNLTGSVVSVSAKDIQDIPVANTTTLLQGRLPGLVLTQNGAQAGNDNPEIRIRGIGTFGNNNPMVLIDGVEGSISQIAEIPSADIESISVLKDAASAAIYGVRAANGVILITTKRGQASSKVKISYSGSYTLQTPGIVPDYEIGRAHV